jgi:crossover junction endodeoxyribonuclease RusA
MLEVFVAGNPAPKGSRAYKGHRNGRAVLAESSKYAKPWQNVIAAIVGAEWGCRPQMIGPVVLHLDFVMRRPRATPKRAPTPWAIKRPDADKLTRLVFDALTTAGVYRDDSQVVDFRATKRIAEIDEIPGVLIRIAEPENNPCASLEPMKRT